MLESGFVQIVVFEAAWVAGQLARQSHGSGSKERDEAGDEHDNGL